MDVEELIDAAARELRSARERFGACGGEVDEAWELLEYAWGRDLDWEDEVPSRVERRFRRLLARRLTGEPLAYITGSIEFRGLDIGVRRGMFVPRQTSEFLALQAIRRLHRRRRPLHVDLATGVGPVALSVAAAVSRARVWGLDISARALAQARRNAAALGLGNVRFRKSDLYSGLPSRLAGTVDVVTIHPPYVPRKELGDLPAETREFEPRHTLSDGSGDGLELVRRAVEEGRRWLKPGGWLLVEIAPSETRKLKSMARRAGYRQAKSTRGPLGYTRVVAARL